MPNNLCCNDKNEFFSTDGGENKYYSEQFDPRLTIGKNNICLFADQIPEGSQVLDIGCGQGNFGKILREKNCTLYGIERDKVAAESARGTGFFKDIFTVDITDINHAEYQRFVENPVKYDAIILSDVLEHLMDPTEVLVRVSQFVKDGGALLISVPNISHNDIILNLINDRFYYSNMGILDNTHVKFFTKSSFCQWIAQINECVDGVLLDCSYLGATFYNSPFMDGVEKGYPELFGLLGNRINPNGLQILFKLMKIPQGQAPRQLASLLEEKAPDVVQLLGEALKGSLASCGKAELINGEKLWYDAAIADYQHKIEECGRYIAELEANVRNIADIVSKKDKYIHELEEKSRAGADILSGKDEYIRELEERSGTGADILSGKDEYIRELEEKSKAGADILSGKDEYIRELEEKSKAGADLLSGKDEYIHEMENNLNWHSSRVHELEDGIKWHQEEDEKMKKEMDAVRDAHEQAIEKAKDENNALRHTIFEMESSLSWRITKFLRR